jgi:hypothetical protein
MACPGGAVKDSMTRLTFFSQSLLFMRLEPFIAIFSFYSLVGAGFGEGQGHGLVEQIEALQRIDGILRGIDRVEDDERLAFGFEILLGDNVDDFAEFAENVAQRGGQRGDFDAFVEVSDLLTDITHALLDWKNRKMMSERDILWIVSYIYAMDKRLVYRRELLRVFVRSAMYERCVGRDFFSHD